MNNFDIFIPFSIQHKLRRQMQMFTSENTLKASNYLDMGKLLDSGCKTVANMIKGKTPEEIRRTFTIRRTRPNEGNVIPGTEANGGN